MILGQWVFNIVHYWGRHVEADVFYCFSQNILFRSTKLLSWDITHREVLKMWPVNQKQWTSMSNSAMGIFEPFSAFWKLTTERVLFSLLLLRLSGNFSWKYWVGSSWNSSRKVLPNSWTMIAWLHLHLNQFIPFIFCVSPFAYKGGFTIIDE